MTQKKPQQPETKFIKSLFTRVLGFDQSLDSEKVEKPKLVFLHGLLGNGQNWVPIAKDLEKNFTILLLDQRGHGKSYHPETYEPKDFAQDLKVVLDELGWKKVHLVGHSLGGRVLFEFAYKYSEYIESLVIEDMGPHITGPSSQGTADMIKSVPTPFSSRTEAKSFFEDSFKEKYGDVLSGYLYSNLEKKDNGEFDWRFSLKGALKCIEIGQKVDFWEQYNSIKSQSLLVRGETSNHLPLNIYKEMLSKNTNVQGVEIPGAGHWVHFDQKDLFVEALKKFLLKN